MNIDVEFNKLPFGRQSVSVGFSCFFDGNY